MKDWKWTPWELFIIGFAIITIILAIIGYYVEAVAPYGWAFACILVTINVVSLIVKRKETKEKR